MTPAEAVEQLAALYGRPQLHPSGDPLAELILTVLSQNTADTNSGRAFTALLSRYASWDEVLAAPTADLVETIRPGGLAPQKAPRIQAILARVLERTGGWDLGFLADAPFEDARAWLRALPGVGPKTAACVLLFALGRPALPVDTHVERVAKRLGYVPPRLSADAAHSHLEALIDPADFYTFHMLLIKHGRRTCSARNPACDRCPLAAGCPSADRKRLDPAVEER